MTRWESEIQQLHHYLTRLPSRPHFILITSHERSPATVPVRQKYTVCNYIYIYIKCPNKLKSTDLRHRERMSERSRTAARRRLRTAKKARGFSRARCKALRHAFTSPLRQIKRSWRWSCISLREETTHRSRIWTLVLVASKSWTLGRNWKYFRWIFPTKTSLKMQLRALK